MKPTIEVVDPVMAAVLRQMTEAERLRIAWGMCRSARDMLLYLLRAVHPEWSQRQVEQEAARRLAHADALSWPGNLLTTPAAA
jgi:hypothetical protein